MKSTFLPPCLPPRTLVVAGMLALATAHANAAAPDSVQIFGDSAADQGNLNATPGYAPGRNAPYYRGSDGLLRLSNGPMWTERLFPSLRSINAPGAVGTPTVKNPSLNFAYGAATTGLNTFGAGEAGELPVGVQSQVSAYLALRESGDIPKPGRNSYAFIEAGPNDYFETLATNGNLATTAAQSPARLTDSVRRLTASGIHTVFVTETPDFAHAPLFVDAGLSNEARAELNAVAATSRANLRTELGKLQATLGDAYRVVVLPANALFKAILAQPGQFGFTNVTGKIYDDTNDTLLEADARKQDGYLFVDSLHLTAKAQAWQAKYYSEVIGAIDGTVHEQFAAMTEGLREGADLLSRAGSESMTGSISPDRWTWFVTARGGLARGSLETGNDWRSNSLATLVGARRTLNSKWDFGLGLGTLVEQGRIDSRALRWKNDGNGVWLLNTVKLERVIARFNFGIAHLDTRTTRDPSIPTFVARGDSSGYLLTSRLEVEHDLGEMTSSLRPSIVLGTTFSRSHVKGFDESGAEGLNLRISRLQRDSIRSDAGVRLRATPFQLGSVSFEPSADFVLTYESGDRDTEVTAQLLNNSAAPVRVAVPQGSRTGGEVRFNLGAAITPRLRAQLTDVVAVRSSDEHEHRIQLGLSASF